MSCGLLGSQGGFLRFWAAWIVLLSAWSISCGVGAVALTRLESQSARLGNPTVYRRLLVQVPIRDLEARHFAELEFTRYARQLGLDSVLVASHEIFFPGKSYSEDEVQAQLESNQVDGLLLVRIAGVGSTSIYLPRTAVSYVSSTGTFSASSSSGVLQSSGTSVTTESGGYPIEAPWAAFDLDLVDATSGEVVWIATARTRGTPEARDLDLLGSFVREGIEKLVMDGFLEVGPIHISGEPMHEGPVSVFEGRSNHSLAIRTAKGVFTATLGDVELSHSSGCSRIREQAVLEARRLLSDGARVYSASRTRVLVLLPSGQLLGEELVARGLAMPKELQLSSISEQYRIRLNLAQTSAWRSQIGMWADKECRP